MKVYLVRAEHFSVPGLVVKVFQNLADARNECVELVNIMLEDNSCRPDATGADWQHRLELLQSEHGAANCYVELDELEVTPSSTEGRAP